MNAALAVAFLALACYIVLVRLHPFKMRRWADWLNARADAEDYHKRQFAFYQERRMEHERLERSAHL